MCFTFARFGECQYGADCRFSHSPKPMKLEDQFDKFPESNRMKPKMLEEC